MNKYTVLYEYDQIKCKFNDVRMIELYSVKAMSREDAINHTLRYCNSMNRINPVIISVVSVDDET